jgi:hypothetical protein
MGITIDISKTARAMRLPRTVRTMTPHPYQTTAPEPPMNKARAKVKLN